MASIDDRFYDSLEVRGAEERDAAQLAALPGLVRHALGQAPGLAADLAGVDPDGLTSFAALADLPVLRKSDLIERQRADPPFGGLNAAPLSRIAKVFASPGPIFEPELARPDYWRFARAMFAAGFRPGDLVHNSFAYHLTPGGSMMENGAHGARLPGDSGRHRPDRPAGPGDRPAAARGVRRHAVVPAYPARARSRRGAADGLPAPCPGLRRGLSARARRGAADAARHRRISVLRDLRHRPDRLREPRRATAS